MGIKIAVIICCLAYLSIISGTPCGKHKREPSDEPSGGSGSEGSGSGGSGGSGSGSPFPGPFPQPPSQLTGQFQNVCNFKPGGNHNNNENNAQKPENPMTSFLPGNFHDPINADAPENRRGKRSEGEEKPTEGSNSLTSHFPDKDKFEQISTQLQQFSGYFTGKGDKGDKEEAPSSS